MLLESTSLLMSFVAAQAILANACAILLNGASARYGLAISQWRDFRGSFRDQYSSLSDYTDSAAALTLAERRIRLLLSMMGLLHIALLLFVTSTLLALLSMLLSSGGASSPSLSIALQAMLAAGGGGLTCLIVSTINYIAEGACGRSLLGLHAARG